MTFTKPQFKNLRNHRVTESQSQIQLKGDRPCSGGSSTLAKVQI